MVAMIQMDHTCLLELITSMVNDKIEDVSSLRFDVHKAGCTIIHWDLYRIDGSSM